MPEETGVAGGSVNTTAYNDKRRVELARRLSVASALQLVHALLANRAVVAGLFAPWPRASVC